MLARLQAGDRLGGVHLRRRRENDRFDLGARQRFVEALVGVRDGALGGERLDVGGLAADHADDLDAVDRGERVEVLDAKCARGAGDADLHFVSPWEASADRIRSARSR